MNFSSKELPPDWRKNKDCLLNALLDLNLIDSLEEFSSLEESAEEVIKQNVQIKNIDINTLPSNLRILVKRLRKLTQPKQRLQPIENFINFDDFPFLKDCAASKKSVCVDSSITKAKTVRNPVPPIPTEFLTKPNLGYSFEEFINQITEGGCSKNPNKSEVQLISVKDLVKINSPIEISECLIIEKCILNPNAKVTPNAEAWVVSDMSGSVIFIVEDAVITQTKPLFNESGYTAYQLLPGTVVKLESVRPKWISDKLVTDRSFIDITFIDLRNNALD